MYSEKLMNLFKMKKKNFTYLFMGEYVFFFVLKTYFQNRMKILKKFKRIRKNQYILLI